MKKISETLSFVKKHGLFPNTPVVESPHAPEVVVDGKKVLMFATNNYLGMMKDSRVIESAVEGVRKWGIGNGSARLLTGNLEIHNQLEAKIASFKKREAAISFVTGYMANAGSLPALANVYEPSLLSFMTGKTVKNRDTVFFSDENNHASIIAGIRLSKSEKVVYKHCDPVDLEEKETWRREKLLENAKYLREKLNELKFNTGNSSTQIIPIIIGDEKEAMKLSQSLLERNIFVPVARWPAVPKGSARLRLTVTCEHSKEQIDVLVKNLGEIGRELGVVK